MKRDGRTDRRMDGRTTDLLWYEINVPFFVKKKRVYQGHFYVRRSGLYLYKYRIYGTISIMIFERSSFCLSTDINFTSLALSSVKTYSFE